MTEMPSFGSTATASTAVDQTSREKQRRLHSIIYSDKEVDIDLLRKACATGIPSESGLRPIIWKLLLQLIPAKRNLWRETLEKKREQYSAFRTNKPPSCHPQDFIIDPNKIGKDVMAFHSFHETQHAKEHPQVSRSQSMVCDVTHKEHPLALEATSKWNAYFQDGEMREQIERDVERTHPTLPFFNGNDQAFIHQQDMKRALFLFAKVNPGLTYVQGMNEIYAPLYQVFKTSKTDEFGEKRSPDSADHAEADAFFCFVDLMSEFRDTFCKQLDNSTSGIKGTIDKFSELLKKSDTILWDHLRYETEIDPHFFVFRWSTLLLTKEFHFDNILRLWDVLFSEPPCSRQNFLLRLCVSILINIRKELLGGDYTANMKLLQNLPDIDLDELLRVARLIDRGKKTAISKGRQ